MTAVVVGKHGTEGFLLWYGNSNGPMAGRTKYYGYEHPSDYGYEPKWLGTARFFG